jgi:hypothetical protein
LGFGSGVDVLNVSTIELNASNVAWDTNNADAGPDYFQCSGYLDSGIWGDWWDRSYVTDCTCLTDSCTYGPDFDEMGGVTVDAGINRSGATLSSVSCN